MPNSYRIKLSDGTTTIDLMGTSQKVRYGGLNMPIPEVIENYVGSPFVDGKRLSSAHYGNRIIELVVRLYGTSQAGLKTSVRQIEQLLSDAEKRTLLGYGAKVYLEYQWGDTSGQSTFFDIIRGNLVMPPNYLTQALNQNYVIDARIVLTCKPFGRYTNQDIAQDTLENSQSAFIIKNSYLGTTDANFAEIHGNNWRGVLFTPTENYTAVVVAVRGVREGSPTTLTLALYATAANLPTGAALATGTVDISAIPTDLTLTFGGYYLVTLTVPRALVSGTEYALVASHAGGSAANNFHWSNNAPGAGGNGVTSADGGATWAADAGNDRSFAIFAAETAANYQDVTTVEGHGDVPARMYLKIGQSGATASKNIWVAKRSGTRQTDDLWTEGEDNTSFTNIIGGTHLIVNLNQADTAVSGGLYKQVAVSLSGSIAANSAIARLNYNITSPPRGQFRLLVRAKVVCDTAADYDHLSFGYGYSYGAKTKAPAEANVEYYQCAANNTWEVLDLGTINIPPVAESEIAGNNTFQLRIFLYATTILSNVYYKFEIDWFMLLPIDEGAVIISNTASSDIIALDGITDPESVFKIDTASLVSDYPTHTGKPFKLGRESTRIYILRDDLKAVTFTSDLKYQPQFLVI